MALLSCVPTGGLVQLPLQKIGREHEVICWGHVVSLVRSHMNGLKPFERTIEQTTKTMPPSPKTITAAAMTTNRITSSRELLHHQFVEVPDD